MSEVSDQIESVTDAVVEVAAKVAAPVVVAAETVARTPAKPATKAVKSVTRPSTKNATKRIAKPRVKAAVKTAAAKPAATASAPKRKPTAKAATTNARRAYVRKTVSAAKTATAPLIEGSKIMTDNNWFSAMPTMPAIPGADKFQAMFGDVSAKGQDAVKKSQAFAGQLSEAAKANMEAVAESSRIATAGVRDLGTEIVATTKSSVEQATAAVKSLTEAKSPTEFFQLQSDMLRASFDRMVADGSKLTEQMVKFAGEAVQPLSNRASVNAEKFSELTA